MHALIRRLVNEELRSFVEAIIRPSDVPGTLTFWHGGDLDATKDAFIFSKSRYEYGPGLYLTTSYALAKDYAKGNRKLYMVNVTEGKDISDSRLSEEAVKTFILGNVATSRRKDILQQVMKWSRGEEGISAEVFLNIMLNESALKASSVHLLREFLVNSGVDYHITGNIRHNGDMMVLFNMKKIVNVTRVMSGDKIEVFDLK